jgi:hypothetical protein
LVAARPERIGSINGLEKVLVERVGDILPDFGTLDIGRTEVGCPGTCRSEYGARIEPGVRWAVRGGSVGRVPGRAVRRSPHCGRLR